MTEQEHIATAAAALGDKLASPDQSPWRYDEPPQNKEVLAAWRVGSKWFVHPVVYCEERKSFVEAWAQESEITPERWMHMPPHP